MTDTNTPDVPEEGGPVKRDMKAIKAAAAAKAESKKPAKPAAKARNKAASDAAKPPVRVADDEVPAELTHHEQPKSAASVGQFWLAYLGPLDQYLCYRATSPLLFSPQSWSNGYPVALVAENFGNCLIETAVIKTYADGSQRRPEDYEDMYAPFEEVANVRRSTGRRKSARV